MGTNIKAYHIHRPDVVFEVDHLDIDKLIKDGHIWKYGNSTLLYQRFVLDCDIDNDVFQTDYVSTPKPKDIHTITVQIADENIVIDNVDILKFGINTKSKHLTYDYHPVIKIDDFNIYIKSETFKLNYLVQAFGILPKQYEGDDEDVHTDDEIMSVKFRSESSTYIDSFAGEDIHEFFKHVKLSNGRLIHTLTGDELLEINDNLLDITSITKQCQLLTK